MLIFIRTGILGKFVIGESYTKYEFGCAVLGLYGMLLIGKFEIKSIEGDGFIDFKIINNKLFTGEYKFTTGLFNWECVIPFDYKDRKYSFKIFCKDENQYGLFKIEHVCKK